MLSYRVSEGILVHVSDDSGCTYVPMEDGRENRSTWMKLLTSASFVMFIECFNHGLHSLMLH